MSISHSVCIAVLEATPGAFLAGWRPFPGRRAAVARAAKGGGWQGTLKAPRDMAVVVKTNRIPVWATCTTHLEPMLVGIGMFTGHGHVDG